MSLWKKTVLEEGEVFVQEKDVKGWRASCSQMG